MIIVQNISVLKPLQSKFKEPFPVLLATPTSVLVDTAKSTSTIFPRPRDCLTNRRLNVKCCMFVLTYYL